VETGRLIRQISSEPGGVQTLCWCPMATGCARYVAWISMLALVVIERNNVTVYRRFRLGISVRMRCLLLLRSTFTGGLRLALSARGRCARLPRCTGGALHFTRFGDRRWRLLKKLKAKCSKWLCRNENQSARSRSRSRGCWTPPLYPQSEPQRNSPKAA